MQYEGNPWETINYGAEEALSPEEQAFLNDHDGDKELERARWTLLRLSKEHRISIDAIRNALLQVHIRMEARRIAHDAERLWELMEYVTRSDIEPDETNYLSMSPTEFRACERRIREAVGSCRK